MKYALMPIIKDIENWVEVNDFDISPSDWSCLDITRAQSKEMRELLVALYHANKPSDNEKP